MLISPPFLPEQGALSDPAWLDAAMPHAPRGRFPVSQDFAWHGGRHLVAPIDSNRVGMLVRAIADGVVVYLRPRNERVDSIDDPLNYGDGFTSDGVVVVKHTTDIGADAQGQPVEVTFYSVYMHLHSIRETVQQGRRIYRKDPIGQAGHIYGQPNHLHFEIRCDDANLARLVGRSSGDVEPLYDGRTDVLFGEVYFSLPAHTSVYGQRPLPNHLRASMQPPTPPATKAAPRPATPPPEPLQPVHMTREHLIVGLRYAGGQGEPAHRGDAVVSTYHLDGGVEGKPLREAEAEYKLYQTCTRISESYPPAGRPAPSAVYELLRFGRVIGPDPLTIDVPHWREVNYPGGTGWVNLNAVNVNKFSDADFPQWRGWKLVDDDTGGDSHCDSATISRIVYDHGAQCLQPSRQHAFEQLDNPAVKQRLARTVCKFPSEWDASTIDQRWSWLMVATDEHPEPLTSEDYEELKAHITALSFPLPELFAAQWCFEPKSFIGLWRGNFWLTFDNLQKVYPETPEKIIDRYRLAINQVLRRYGLNEPRRASHFFGQGLVETLGLQVMVEGTVRFAANPNHPSFQSEENGYYADTLNLYGFFHNYEKIGNDLGNVERSKLRDSKNTLLDVVIGREKGRPKVIMPLETDIDVAKSKVGDGMKFRGRGFKQLTGRSNYSQYWVFRGWLCAGRDFDQAWWISTKNSKDHSRRPAPIPDPQKISTVPFNCIDSGGQFAVRNGVNRAADGGMAPVNFNAVSKIINRYDINSFEKRLNGSLASYKILGP